MTGLETAVLIVGLVCMSLIIIYLVAMLVIAMVILRKVSKMQSAVQEKLDMVSNIPFLGKTLWKAVRH